jgi:tetratricopeptide (TPR) repeat protein
VRRNALLLSLALAVAGASTPAVAEPTGQERGTARRLMDAGKKAFKARSYQDAARYFEAAYAADGSLTIALYNRAFALRKIGDLKTAASVFRKFLEAVPDDLDAVFGLAECERGLGDAEAARTLYERYVREERREKKKRYIERAQAFLKSAASTVDPVIAHAAGDKAYRAGKYADAAERYREAFDADPMRTQALYRAALSLRKAERYKEARAAYQQFLGLVPNDPDATYGLAETARLMDDLVLAVRAYERYAELEHRLSEKKYKERATRWAATLRAKAKKAGVVVDRADPAPAAKPPTSSAKVEKKPVEKKPVESKPDDAAASPRLAKLLGGAAEPKPEPEPKAEPKPEPKPEPKAEPEAAAPSPRLAKLLGAAPAEPAPEPKAAPKLEPLAAPRFEKAPGAAIGARVSVARALVEQVPADRPEAALDAAARALALDPTNARAYGVKIAALQALGRTKDASEAAEAAKAGGITPDDVELGGEAAVSQRAVDAAAVARQEAESLLGGGRAEEAEAAALRALSLQPGDYPSLLALGRARRVRDPRASIAVFQRALVVAPERAQPLFEVAQALRAVGDRYEENRYLALYLRKEGAPDLDDGLLERAKRRIEDP